MKTREAKLKTIKRVTLATVSTLTATTIALINSLVFDLKETKQAYDYMTKGESVLYDYSDTTTKKINPQAYLIKLRQTKLPTTTKNYNGAEYKFVNEEDIIKLSKEFSIAIERYFKSCDASYWTNESVEQFWPEDIEYIITAISYKESSYRADVMNEIGCGGLTGLNKETMLDTFANQWLTPKVWGDKVPQVNCNPNEVDILNPTTCIEYTYYNIGYNLANRFKKDKYFIDIDGTKRSVWDEISYTEDMQNRLIIASHLFGVNNVVDSVFERNYDKDGNLIPINKYIYSKYVEDVLDKAITLSSKYNYNYGY